MCVPRAAARTLIGEEAHVAEHVKHITGWLVYGGHDRVAFARQSLKELDHLRVCVCARVRMRVCTGWKSEL